MYHILSSFRWKILMRMLQLTLSIKKNLRPIVHRHKKLYAGHCLAMAVASFTAQNERMHYGCFWEILSQNWGMNFDSSGCIFISFLKVLATKVHKSADHLPSFGIFEIEAKLQLQGLNLKLEFWNENSQNWP